MLCDCLTNEVSSSLVCRKQQLPGFWSFLSPLLLLKYNWTTAGKRRWRERAQGEEAGRDGNWDGKPRGLAPGFAVPAAEWSSRREEIPTPGSKEAGSHNLGERPVDYWSHTSCKSPVWAYILSFFQCTIGTKSISSFHLQQEVKLKNKLLWLHFY